MHARLLAFRGSQVEVLEEVLWSNKAVHELIISLSSQETTHYALLQTI